MIKEGELFDRPTYINIEDELKKSYLDYAMSVIIGRALPDVRDGLKPVHRRIIYTQYISGNHAGKPYKKSARIVGDVMGKFHPHGDAAVYDSIVRMAQDFSMRHPLVDGQGNFGSIDGDAPAAMRYTEIRMAKIAHEMVADIEKETVDFVPNYDGEEKEPVVLPAMIPNLLVNGSSGIAVGMATNIPPHNLAEICDGVIAQIQNPDISNAELMKHIKGPDFPTAGIILGREGIKSAYETGRGHIRVRARAHIEEIRKDKEAIVITEIPYQVNKANLIEKIADLVRDKRVSGITDIRDESNREGIRVVLELGRGEIGEIILKQLYKFTEMETTFGVQMLAVDGNQPKTFDLKGMLNAFILHRKDVVVKRTKFDLRKSKERAHILEGLTIALDNLDAVIELIKASENPEVAKKRLMEKFSFSEVQAKAILDMRLQRLTGLERDKIVSEYKELLLTIKDLEDILSSETRQKNIMIDEMKKIKEEYADARKTEIVEQYSETSIEELIVDEEMVISATHGGYIKRTKAAEYRSQLRGGKGRSGMATREDDFVEHLFVAMNKDSLLFFSNRGKIYHLKVYEVPEASPSAKGRALVNLLNLDKDEKIVSFVSARGCFDDNHFLVLATKKGVVKKTPMTEYSQIRSNGKFAITFKNGDELIGAAISDGSSYIFLATKGGKSIIFPEEDVRATGRTSQGVVGMRLKNGDEVVELEVLNGTVIDTEDEDGAAKALSIEGDILTVTKNGYGKRSPLNFYRIQGRGGSGIINIMVTEKNGPMVGGLKVVDSDEIMVVTAKGQLIRTKVSGISRIGRRTQGLRIISLEEGDEVAGVAKLIPEEEE
ncbi:MAG: DNA gyrase subunit A [Acidobacteriota bacterium]|nr:DNA gyrase subunit A [Thermoanaerobaculaceae bacterium]